MDRTACRVCGNPVNPAARECPSCGAANPAAPGGAVDPGAGPGDTGKAERPKRGGKPGCIAILVVALVLAVIVWALSLVF